MQNAALCGMLYRQKIHGNPTRLCAGERRGAVSAGGNMNRAWIELDKEALAHNLRAYAALLPAGCKVMAVVKADSYGHGAKVIAPYLQELGVDHFAVAALDEAVELRESGVTAEILILGYTDPADFPVVERLGLTQTATSSDHAAMLERYGKESGRPLKVHIAVDSGMHRIGFEPVELDALEHYYASEHIRVTGIYSHMCVADTDEEEHVAFTHGQAAVFAGVADALKARGVNLGTVHLLSTYAAINYPEYAYDYARLGIMLHGVRSDSGDYLRQPIDLKPVMILKAHITSVREIGPGESVSYGRIFRAQRPTRVASAAIGYADGIPRCLSGGKLRAIVRGEYAPGIGRVCMDQLMLDVTDIPDVKTGDVAVFIGRDGDKAIYAEELAQNAGTITNELLSRMGKRLEGRRFR